MNTPLHLMTGLRIATVGVILGLSSLTAQTPTPAPKSPVVPPSPAPKGPIPANPVPKGPFVAILPPNSSWRIDYVQNLPPPPKVPTPTPTKTPHHKPKVTPTPTKTPPPKVPAVPPGPPFISSITIVRDSGLRRETIDWSDKSETQKWVFKDFLFTQQKMGGDFVVNTTELSMGIGSVYPDFPQLIWLNKEAFQSVEVKNGQKCFVYVWTDYGLGSRPVNSPIPVEPTKVWIAIDTKLPVAIEDKDFRATFKYNLPGDPNALVLPPQCQSLLAELSQSNGKLESQQMARP